MKIKMKSILIVTLLLAFDQGFAATAYTCQTESYQGSFKMIPDVSEYEIIVDDSNDTLTWFKIIVSEHEAVSAVEMEAGNDSDNYYGYPTNSKVICQKSN